MDDLIAFVTARLDEDEAAAKAAFRSVLEADGFHVRAPARPGVPPLPVADAIDAETAVHIARHDPARVLREVAAKRAILRRCSARMNEMDQYPNGLVSPRALLARQTLMDVATAWSDHPDYRDEWKP